MSRARSVSQLVGANTALGNTVITGTASVSTNTFTVGTTLYSVANGNVGIGTSSPPAKASVKIGSTGGSTNLGAWGDHFVVSTGETTGSLGFGVGVNTANDIVHLYAANPLIKWSPMWIHGSEFKFHTGGNLSAAIDTSGRVTMPYQPAFCAHKNSGVSYTTANSVVPFGEAEVNIGNCYSTSTNRFTAPVAGVYMISVTLYGVTNPSTHYLRKNGTMVARWWTALSDGGAVWSTHTMTKMISMSVNDYLDVYLSSGSVGDATQSIFFTGHLVG